MAQSISSNRKTEKDTWMQLLNACFSEYIYFLNIKFSRIINNNLIAFNIIIHPLKGLTIKFYPVTCIKAHHGAEILTPTKSAVWLVGIWRHLGFEVDFPKVHYKFS